jgi:hypothetical protein
MSRSTRLRHGLTLLLTTTALVAATGCGGSSDDDPPKDEAAAVQGQAIKFAKCMREHGVDMPDPKVSGEGGRMLSMGAVQMDDAEAADGAFKACEKLAPKAPAMSAEEKQAATDEAIKTAKCMREHGVDMPDPTASGMTKMTDVDPDSPTFKAAIKACGGPAGRVTMAAPTAPSQ